MTASRFTLGIFALVLMMGIGAFAGEKLGAWSGSVWLSALLGFVIAVGLFLLADPLMRRAAEEGYITRRDENRSGPMTTIVCLLIVGAIGLFLILGVDVDRFGAIDYSRPYIGGFWFGIVSAAVAEGLKQKAKAR